MKGKFDPPAGGRNPKSKNTQEYPSFDIDGCLTQTIVKL
jgi:hypothetical protein